MGHRFNEPVGCAVVPAGQKKPAGHGFVVPDACPARQKNPAGHWPEHAGFVRPVDAPNVPAGHGMPTVPVPVGQYAPSAQGVPTAEAALTAQNVPALHGLPFARVVPAAVQKPAEQGPEHALVERPSVPPKVPAAHGVGALEPAGQ
jgi:hypothetical protein